MEDAMGTREHTLAKIVEAFEQWRIENHADVAPSPYDGRRARFANGSLNLTGTCVGRAGYSAVYLWLDKPLEYSSSAGQIRRTTTPVIVVSLYSETFQLLDNEEVERGSADERRA